MRQPKKYNFNFSYAGKTVTITNVDKSSGNVVEKEDKNWEQTVYDNVADSKVFSISEMNELASISLSEFCKCVKLANKEASNDPKFYEALMEFYDKRPQPLQKNMLQTVGDRMRFLNVLEEFGFEVVKIK